jgi:hypothetical protein
MAPREGHLMAAERIIILLLNSTPIRWVSKRQKTVETSTYGSELVAARMAVEVILEYRYHL